MFRIGLTLPFLATAPKGFSLKPGSGGKSKGPATKPFLIQVATVSVRRAPCSIALFEFSVVMGGKTFLWYASAPIRKSFITLLALLLSDLDIFSLALRTIFLSFRMFTFVAAFLGRALFGNLAQKASLAPFS